MHHRELIPVGTRCRVRGWDELEAEFGLNSFGNCDCDAVFTDEMRVLGGLEFTVKSCRLERGGKYYIYTSEEGIGTSFYITGDMLEILDAPEDDQIEVPADYTSLLFG